MLHPVQNPLGLQLGLSFIPPLLSSPHSSLPPLLHPALLFIFLSALLLLLLLLRTPLSLTTPSCPVMDIGGVIS